MMPSPVDSHDTVGRRHLPATPANDDCARDVLAAYVDALRITRAERLAFDDAVRAWRQHNPTASPEKAAPAVATIICHKI
jgi:hypothetical protein